MKVTQRFNVVRAKNIGQNPDGSNKTMWLQVGMITEFENGNKILEMNDKDQTYQIFPVRQQNQQQNQQQPQQNQQPPQQQPPQEPPQQDQINVQNIPF